MCGGTRGVAPVSRRLLALALATLAAVVALPFGMRVLPLVTSEAAVAPEAPNVLVIETDDQTVESMRVMQKTSALIGSQGATFTNSFVNFSLCCPSRATFLTGQYAHNHGVWNNQPPNGGFQRFESLHANDNLAVWLQRAGYYTAVIGKYLNEYENKPLEPPGWSEWHVPAPDDQKAYDYTFNDNRTLTTYGHARADYKQDVLTRKAVYFLKRRASKPRPFFLWLTYTAPHISGPNPNPNPPSNCNGAAKPPPRYARTFASEPLPRPPNFNEADVSDKPAGVRHLPRLDDGRIATIERRYRCELEALLAVDDGVEKVVETLEAKGDLDNTLLVYTSDNGYFHGEHRIPDEKRRAYEESIRVPLLIRGPGIPPGVVIDPLVINADLAPTVLDAAGVAPGLEPDGRSLLEVIQRPALERNRALLVEEPTLKAIRTPRFAYAEHANGGRELYDLEDDPYELQNLDRAPAYASAEATLRHRLHDLEACAGAACRVHRADPPVP
jgi:N-acetylglucosamine-6-sulfatase